MLDEAAAVVVVASAAAAVVVDDAAVVVPPLNAVASSVPHPASMPGAASTAPKTAALDRNRRREAAA